MNIDYLLLKFTEIQSYEFMGVSLLQISAAIIVFAGMMLLRGTFERAFLNTLRKLESKTSTIDEEMVISLKPAFRLFYLTLAVVIFYFIGIEYLIPIHKIIVFDILLWRLVAAAVVFLFVIFLRIGVRRFVFNILRKMVSKTETDLDDRLIAAIQPCFKYFYYILAIWISFYVTGLENIDSFVNLTFRSLLVIVVAWAVYRGLDIVIYVVRNMTAKTETELDDYLAMFVGKTCKVLVVAIAIIMVLHEWGYDVTSIIAGLGIGGLAVALGGKDFVANIFGFFTIFMDRSFSVGDWIFTPDVEGTVEDVGIRSTKVRTFAQALVTIPNSVLANKPITNWSKMGKRRITFKLGVTYGSKSKQIDELSEKIKNMLTDHPEIHKDTIFVYFSDFNESSLDLFLYFFTNTTVWKEFLAVQHDVKLKMMEIIEDMGMSVAFPSRSVYMEDFDEKMMNVMKEIQPVKMVKQ